MYLTELNVKKIFLHKRMISKKNVLQVKPIAIASIKIARRTCVSLNALKRFSIRNDLKAQKAR
jgi:hypothetical protein